MASTSVFSPAVPHRTPSPSNAPRSMNAPLPENRRRLLRRAVALLALVAGATGFSQTAAAFLANGKAALTARDLAAAQTAFTEVLGREPANQEAHLYLGLVELLLFLDGEAVSTALAAANAEPVIDWETFSIGFTWSALESTETALRDALQWEYLAAPGAVGGDVLRARAYHAEIPGYGQSILTANGIVGPGTLRFRYRLDGLPQSFRTLDLIALHTDESWGYGLGNWELNSTDWQEAVVRLEEGSFRLQWSAYSDGWTSTANPGVWLDELRYLPDAGPASPVNHGGTTGATLANGFDNADFALSSETWVYLDYEDGDFVDPDFNTAILQDLVGGPVRDQLEASLQHLAAVGSTGFRSVLVWNENPVESVTIDYGDVLLLRAGLEGLLALSQMLYADNYAVVPAMLDALSEHDVFDSTQATLTLLPDLFKRVRPEAGPRAEAAWRRAFSLYEVASDFVRARPDDGTIRLFNLAPGQFADEAAVREEFARVIDALDTPEPLPVSELETVDLDLGALFDSSTDWRAVLPLIQTDTPVAGTFPDPTLNGLLRGMEAATLESILRADDAIFDQPVDWTNLTVHPDRAHASGRSAPAVVVEGLQDDGEAILLAVLQEDGRPTWSADWRRYLWRPTTGSLERIDLNAEGQPFETVHAAQLSGDGAYLFLALRDAGLLGWNPGQTVSVGLDRPVLLAPDVHASEPFYDSRRFALTAGAPNAGAGRSRAVLRLALAEDRHWFRGTLQLESPTGVRYNAGLGLERWNDQNVGQLVFQFGAGTAADLTGEWKLTFINSLGGCCREPEVVVESLHFIFDGPPVVLARRALDGDAWELLSRTADGSLAAVDILSSLSASHDGAWAAFTALADDLVPELVGAFPVPFRPRASFLMDVENSRSQLLTASSGSGPGLFDRTVSIAGNGRRVAFLSRGPLIPADTNGLPDVYVYDRIDASMTRASVSDSGFQQTEGGEGGSLSDLFIHADGSVVGFASNYATLREDVPGSYLSSQAVFLRDLVAGTTEAYGEWGLDAGGPALSPDGRYLYFHQYDWEQGGFDRWVVDRTLAEERRLVPTLDPHLTRSFNGIQTPYGRTWIAPAAGLAVLTDDRGSVLRHSFGDAEVSSVHLEGTPATRVAMGQTGIYLTEEGASVGIPVHLHPGATAPTGPVEVTFATSGRTALPWQHFRGEALALTLTSATPDQTLFIPVHSHAFLASVGVFEVRLATVSSPARIGYPRSTVIALERFADPDRYAAWLLVAFPDPADRETPLIAGPLADPEGDGWFNLLEFALGRDPLVADHFPPVEFSPAPLGDRDTFKLRYNTRSGLRYFLELSPSLDHWTRHAIENFEVVNVSELGDGIVELTLRWPYSQIFSRFYRLVVESPD